MQVRGKRDRLEVHDRAATALRAAGRTERKFEIPAVHIACLRSSTDLERRCNRDGNESS
jgi:hypothetical protein